MPMAPPGSRRDAYRAAHATARANINKPRPAAPPARPPIGQTTSPRPPIGQTAGGGAGAPQMPGRSVAPPTPASTPGRGPSLPSRPPIAMKKGGKVPKTTAKSRSRG